ncbi:MAG: PepSY-like domain-containing protein [Prevotella sp.]|jgi:hypothetical protein|nr:PepSY-like domain-containing protein [Prevotella sp.]
MKAINLFPVSVLSILLLLSCNNNDDNYLDKEDLPLLTKSFIDRYLPNHKILKIEDLNPQGKELDKYKVTFSDDLTIVFNELGYWWRTESCTKLPESLFEAIPADEFNALKEKYPDLEIKAIYNDVSFTTEELYKDVPFLCRLKLTDDTDVFLYPVGGNKVTVGINLNEQEDKIPLNVKEFVNQYYKGKKIDLLLHAEEHSGQEVYKIYLSEPENTLNKESAKPEKFKGLVVLDKNGEWLRLSHPDREYPIPEELYETLTAYAKAYIAEHYSDNTVYEIIRQEGWYDIRIDKWKYLSVSYEKAPMFRLDVIQKFVWKHFNSEYLNQRFTIESHIQDKVKRYYTTIEIYDPAQQTICIGMESFIDGEWLVLETRNTSIPESVFDTLPAGIKTWLKDNSVLAIVNKITKTDDGNYIIIGFRNNTAIKFDKNGNQVN